MKNTFPFTPQNNYKTKEFDVTMLPKLPNDIPTLYAPLILIKIKHLCQNKLHLGSYIQVNAWQSLTLCTQGPFCLGKFRPKAHLMYNNLFLIPLNSDRV